jgi:hypothetical protein
MVTATGSLALKASPSGAVGASAAQLGATSRAASDTGGGHGTQLEHYSRVLL